MIWHLFNQVVIKRFVWREPPDEAVSRLEKEEARLGQVVRLRFYAGLSVAEVSSRGKSEMCASTVNN